jgi:hypothetical protein
MPAARPPAGTHPGAAYPHRLAASAGGLTAAPGPIKPILLAAFRAAAATCELPACVSSDQNLCIHGGNHLNEHQVGPTMPLLIPLDCAPVVVCSAATAEADSSAHSICEPVSIFLAPARRRSTPSLNHHHPLAPPFRLPFGTRSKLNCKPMVGAAANGAAGMPSAVASAARKSFQALAVGAEPFDDGSPPPPLLVYGLHILGGDTVT